MFSELKREQSMKKKKASKGLQFDDLEEKLSKMTVEDKGKSDVPTKIKQIVQSPHFRSIKNQKPSSTSLQMVKTSAEEEEQRRNSVENGGLCHSESMGLGIFEAATMVCQIVDITTDSTIKAAEEKKQQQQAKKLRGSKGSISSQTGAGPFALIKEATEQKKKKKQSFEDDDEDDEDGDKE